MVTAAVIAGHDNDNDNDNDNDDDNDYDDNNLVFRFCRKRCRLVTINAWPVSFDAVVC